MRPLYLLILLFFYPFLCGFTFDEEVLTICGSKHPNDFIGRFVCNGNLEKENKKLDCAEKNDKFVENAAFSIYSLLDSNYPSKLDEISQIISNEFNITPSKVTSNSDPLRIDLFFKIGLSCESGSSHVVGIYENKDKIINSMRVWRKELKSPSGDYFAIPQFDWDYKSTKNKLDNCIDSIGYISSHDDCSSVNRIEANNIYFLITSLANANLNKFSYRNYDQKKIDSDLAEFQNQLFKLIENKTASYNLTFDKKSSPSAITFQSNLRYSKYLNNSFYIKIFKEEEKIKIVTNLPSLDKKHQIIIIPIIISPPMNDAALSATNVVKTETEYNYFVAIFLPISVAVFFLLMLYISYFKKEKASKDVADHITNANIFRNFAPFSDQSKNTKFNEKPSSINTIVNKENNNLSENESDEFRNIFQAKYPFVSIYVPPSKRDDFIKECKWLEDRMGHFPTELEQFSILKSLNQEN